MPAEKSTVKHSEELGLKNMSVIIRDYSLKLASDDDKILMTEMICNCWNIGGFPEGEFADLMWHNLIEPVISEHYSDPNNALRTELFSIVEDRRLQYRDDPRFIINFDIQPSDEYESFVNIKSVIGTPKEFFAVFVSNGMRLHKLQRPLI